MQAIILLIALTSSAIEIGDMMELPAVLGKMPRLRPPPEGLPDAKPLNNGLFLPAPLDAYLTAVAYTYWKMEEVGQQAIDATREADRKSCTLRLDAAKIANAKECQGCAMGKFKYLLVGGLGGVIIGGIGAILVSK